MSYRIGITLLTSLISSFLDKPEVILSNFFFLIYRESLASELLPFFSSFLYFDTLNQHSLETEQAYAGHTKFPLFYFSSLELKKSRFAFKYFMLFRDILVLLVHGVCIVSYNFSLFIFESVLSAIKARSPSECCDNPHSRYNSGSFHNSLINILSFFLFI